MGKKKTNDNLSNKKLSSRLEISKQSCLGTGNRKTKISNINLKFKTGLNPGCSGRQSSTSTSIVVTEKDHLKIFSW